MMRLTFPSIASAMVIWIGTTTSAHAASCPSASDVRSEIGRVGAKAAVDRNFANAERWNCVLKGIESARPAWLSVAMQLRTASDAGSSSELGDAMVTAFEANPSTVLSAVHTDAGPNRLSVQTVCTPALEPRQGYRAYFDQTEAKLLALKSDTLSVKIGRCITLIQHARPTLIGESR